MSAPPPPWHTFGDALIVPVPVDLSSLRPPPGLALARTSGRAVGLLGVVRYVPPSPLSYRELFWLPARVRASRPDGTTARGWWVAKMLVDDADSLEAGRAHWALPKQLARFDARDGDVTMRGEDGARVAVRYGRGAPLGRRGGAIVTLQRDGDALVRFRGDLEGRVAATRARVLVEGLDGTWQGLRRLGGGPRPAVRLDGFEGWMRAPERGPSRGAASGRST